MPLTKLDNLKAASNIQNSQIIVSMQFHIIIESNDAAHLL